MSTTFTADSNEALCLQLVRAKEDEDLLRDEEERVSVEVFHPKFTYPIFGDDEKIYGYEDLRINLKFSSGSLQQYLAIESTSKIKSADDVEGTLYKFIPPGYYKSTSDFQVMVEKDATDFRPLGEKIYSYARRAGTTKGKTKSDDPINEDDPDAVVYEVYWANWDTPGFRDYHRKMQLFVLLYIEGGSYIHEDEDKWEFVVLFERRRRASGLFTYHFVGYSSLYSFFCWPDKVRLRLSQFVIIGPYQNRGHGASLYKAIYQYVLLQPKIAELTVEDPSEAFEDLRDKCDLRMLIADQEMNGLEPPTDKRWAETQRKNRKMANRQFSRLIEMLIVRKIGADKAQLNRAYRLQVKERLFRFNYEILSQMERNERVEKLEETFLSVLRDYERILNLI